MARPRPNESSRRTAATTLGVSVVIVAVLCLPAVARDPTTRGAAPRAAATSSSSASAPDCTDAKNDETKPVTDKKPSTNLRDEPVSWDAANADVDYKNNTAVFKDIVICNNDIRVHADRAHAKGLAFDNSQWTFEGNVRIHAEQQGNLHADQAVVDFKDNQIAKATVTGSPAEFEQKRADSDQMAKGHAGEIVYDVSQGTVRLSGACSSEPGPARSCDAWLTPDGQYEISAPLLVYNIREQKFQGAAQPGQRVHFTIPPRPKEPEKKP